MSSICKNNGFTLLEVLIALALLTVLAGALYGTYFSVTSGRDRATAGMERRRELAATIDQLRRELAAAYYRREPQTKRLRFVVEDRDFFGKPASTLTFTAIAPPQEGRSDLQEIGYRPIDRQGKMLLARQAKELYLGGEPLSYPQMDELTGFLVECYDGGKWVRSWDTAINFGLPKAVRVTITVKEGGQEVDFPAIATPQVTGS